MNQTGNNHYAGNHNHGGNAGNYNHGGNNYHAGYRGGGTRGGYYPSQRSYFFGYNSPFGAYAWPRYGFYGSGYRPYYGSYGYGYGGYGYPWGLIASRFLFGVPYYGYRPIVAFGGYGGYGGYGYGGYYGGGYSPTTTYYSYQPSDVTVVEQPPVEQALAEQPPTVAESAPNPAMDFAEAGEDNFRTGSYDDAARNWRHALVDDPENGALVLLLGQALFAGGRYDEAAGAVQHALQILPPDKWGVVVQNYKELYPNIQEYTNHLRALEAARDKKDSPAARFLLGYHYGYLGYPEQALKELDKTLELAPKDEVAQKVREQMQAKLKGTDAPAAAPELPPPPPVPAVR